jgi:hypothetical protein
VVKSLVFVFSSAHLVVDAHLVLCWTRLPMPVWNLINAHVHQDLMDQSVMRNGGNVTLQFTRQRVTADDRDLSLDRCVYFLYAWDGRVLDYDSMIYSKHRSRFISPKLICLPSATVCPKNVTTMVRPTMLVIPSTQLMAVTHVPVQEMVVFPVLKHIVQVVQMSKVKGTLT